MRIVVTGATGFIGKRLSEALQGSGHQVVAMGRGTGIAPEELLEGADAVVHLAGESVAQKWSPEVKEKIRDSRALGTEKLVHALSVTRVRPKVLVCASAVGYYGDRGEEVLAEDALAGESFLADVCREWEAKADLAEALGMRVVKVRTGIVLGPNGGALKEMVTPFKAGVGGRLGDGKQWMPWIHLDDISGIFQHAVEGNAAGVLNGVAPGVVRNVDFTTALGKALHRPTVVAVPAFALKLIFGEMGEVMLASQRVVPKATEASGYKFQYPELEAALASLRLAE